MTDFTSVQKHLTAITTAQTEFAKSSFEASKAYFQNLASVKSPDKFVELTTEYAKSAQETFVSEATKIGELYKTSARKPSSRLLQASCPSERINKILSCPPAVASPGLLILRMAVSEKHNAANRIYWRAALCIKTGLLKSPAPEYQQGVCKFSLLNLRPLCSCRETVEQAGAVRQLTLSCRASGLAHFPIR